MIRTPLAYLQLCYLNRDLNQTILCHNTKLQAPKTMCKTRMFPKGRKSKLIAIAIYVLLDTEVQL